MRLRADREVDQQTRIGQLIERRQVQGAPSNRSYMSHGELSPRWVRRMAST
jgi:hypothetical protein